MEKIKTVGAASIATALVAGALAPIAMTNAFAADDTTPRVTITNAADEQGATFKAYNIFTADVSYDAVSGTDTVSNVAFFQDVSRKQAIDATVKEFFCDADGNLKPDTAEFTVPSCVKEYWKVAKDDNVGTKQSAQLAAEMLSELISGTVTYTGGAVDTYGAINPGAAGDSFAYVLAKQFSDGKFAIDANATFSANESVNLGTGYVLIVANEVPTGTQEDSDPAKTQNRAGTAPIFMVTGGHEIKVQQKKAVPTIKKEVRDDSQEPTGEGADIYARTGYSDKADQTIGEQLRFRITVTMPNDLQAYDGYKMIIKDKATNVDFIKNDDDEVVADVWLGEEGSPSGYLGYVKPTLEADGSIKFEINNLEDANPDGKDLIITYTGVVNGKSDDTKENEATLEYSNVPGQPTRMGEATPSKTTISNYEFSIRKTDQDGYSLDGAKFTIKDNHGKYVSFKDGKISMQPSETADTTLEATGGILKLDGLDSGTYTITEVEAPTGRNKLFESFDVTIAEDGTISVPEYTSADLNFEKVGMDKGMYPENADEQERTVRVVNTMGVELPVTGQQGFMILTIAGGIVLICTLAGTIVHRRRMSKNEEE